MVRDEAAGVPGQIAKGPAGYVSGFGLHSYFG